MRRRPSMTLFLPWYLSFNFRDLGSWPSTVKSWIYPSRLRMPAMLSLSLEWGILTWGSNAELALRIRVSMSEMGSFIELPACLGDTRDKARQGGFAEGHARATELAQITVAAAAHRAAVDHPHRAGVARQLREAGVIFLRFEFGAQGGVLFDRLGLLIVAFDPGCFCHVKNSGLRLGGFGAGLDFLGLAFGEGHAHEFKQFEGVFVVAGAGHNRDIHALLALNLVQLDFRKNGLVPDAQRVVTAAVERAGRQPAEIADSRQGRRDQAVKEFIHRVTAQGNVAADGLALAQLEIGDAVPGFADRGLPAGDQREIFGCVVNRAFFERRAHPHVHHDLFHPGNLVRVGVLVALAQGGQHFLGVFLVKSGFHCKFLKPEPAPAFRAGTAALRNRRPSSRWRYERCLPAQRSGRWDTAGSCACGA